MIKRSLTIVFALAVCAFLLLGCGKSEKEKAAIRYEKEYSLSKEDAGTLAEMLYGDEAQKNGFDEKTVQEIEEAVSIASETAVATVPVTEEETEPETEFPKALDFEPCAEWKEISDTVPAVQFLDTMIYAGENIDEAISRIDASEVDITYEYSPSKLMTSRSQEAIYLTVYGEKLLSLDVFNPYDETRKLSELPISGFSVMYSSGRATSCVRYYGGLCEADVVGMDYSEVKEFMEERFPDFKLEYEGKYGESEIELEYNMTEYDTHIERGRWSGYDMTTSFRYGVIVDAETSLVTALNLYTSATWYSLLSEE